MFASEVRKDIEVGPERVTIRKLSARSLEKARDAKNAGMAASLKAMGGDVVKAMRPENVELLQEELRARRENPEQARRARYEQFDRAMILTMGVHSWTAQRKLDSDALEDLDEETSRVLHEAILDLSLPPLDPKDAEAIETKG